MNLFREILGCPAFTSIQHRLQDAMPSLSEAEQAVAKRMQQANKLDEIYALAYEHLGEHEEAKFLRDFMKRPRSPVPEGDELTALLAP